MGLLPSGWLPKAVAVDIDGTITDTGRSLHPQAVTALKQIEGCGIPVIFATGNVRPVTYGLWRLMQLSGPMVCENGGVVWDPNNEKYELRANGERTRLAAEWLGEKIHGLDPKGIGSNEWRESEWCLKPEEDYLKICQHLSASKWQDLAVVKTGFAIHLMEKNLSKGEGLKIALKWMNIDQKDVLAIGDAPNDIPLFEVAGFSVAVGGAFGSVAQAADVLSEYPHCETVIKIADEIANSSK